MAWEEWERLKSTAADQGSTRMQLNRVPDEREEGPAGGGTNGDLTVDHQDLAAVGNSAFTPPESARNEIRDAVNDGRRAGHTVPEDAHDRPAA
ncbi:hypothetical protein [Streptomyces hydrogenans]|uniref:hypothetical protein n=1 Tax=Streptomyces hydrogenans TaxID=1873719 RepID=UPI003319B930